MWCHVMSSLCLIPTPEHIISCFYLITFNARFGANKNSVPNAFIRNSVVSITKKTSSLHQSERAVISWNISLLLLSIWCFFRKFTLKQSVRFFWNHFCKNTINDSPSWCSVTFYRASTTFETSKASILSQLPLSLRLNIEIPESRLIKMTCVLKENIIYTARQLLLMLSH